jgi:RNA polymerase sigma-70 factor (ECF subfamily)
MSTGSRPSPPISATDAQLIEAAYRAHHESVRAFARRLVGEPQAAEDLLQETFVALPRALGRADAQATTVGLLLGICANHARHHVRAAARRRAATTRLGQEPPASSRGPESAAERTQLRASLLRALDQLSIDHRIVIVLCDVEERTAGEVATVLQIPEATVRTRLFHARKRLRSAFEGEAP